MTGPFLNNDEWQIFLETDGEIALADLFDQYRDRLRLAVQLRMDPSLQARVDPSDIIQDSFMEAQRRLPEYLSDPPMVPRLWIRFLAMQQVVAVYRKHVDVQARDVRRDRSLSTPVVAETSSASLAACLMDDGTTPSELVSRAERELRLQRAIEELDPIDREIIVLRHFEQLTNKETSQVLNLKPATASRRYLRALDRLKDVLADPGDDNQMSESKT